MRFTTRLHMLHRILRYRYRTERDSIRYLLKHLEPGSTAIDAGAHRGLYSYWLSRGVGPAGKVYGFEPQPETAEFARAFTTAFACHNVTIENMGLSDRSGRMGLVRSGADDGGAQLTADGNRSAIAGGRGDVVEEVIEVSTISLDEYCLEKSIDSIGFMKIDTEGHELAVFRGAAEVLRAHRPTLLFECFHELARSGEVFDHLTGLGYTGFFLEGDRRIDFREFDKHPYRKPHEVHRNYIFEPA